MWIGMRSVVLRGYAVLCCYDLILLLIITEKRLQRYGVNWAIMPSIVFVLVGSFIFLSGLFALLGSCM
jgi:hypothetical protein